MRTYGAESLLLRLLQTALAASRESASAFVVPTLLLHGEWLDWIGQGRGVHRIDAVADWFREHGFAAERSHFSGAGYPETLRTLWEWQGCDIDVLRQDGMERINAADEYMGTLDRPLIEEFRRQHRRFHVDALESHLVLMQAMTEDDFAKCCQVAFDGWVAEEGRWVSDDYRAMPGAPDLLVWHRNPTTQLWFFCEVKAYGDHLGQSQYSWLRRSWTHIDGRYVLLLLGPPDWA
jgi:hypothetical protein